MSSPNAALFEIDGRCTCGQCTTRTDRVYWMVGQCRNCRPDATLLIQFRFGDQAHPVNCPVCGCTRTVDPNRLATGDDGASYVPVAAS